MFKRVDKCYQKIADHGSTGTQPQVFSGEEACMSFCSLGMVFIRVTPLY
jgi:hypothetical protein